MGTFVQGCPTCLALMRCPVVSPPSCLTTCAGVVPHIAVSSPWQTQSKRIKGGLLNLIQNYEFSLSTLIEGYCWTLNTPFSKSLALCWLCLTLPLAGFIDMADHVHSSLFHFVFPSVQRWWAGQAMCLLTWRNKTQSVPAALCSRTSKEKPPALERALILSHLKCMSSCFLFKWNMAVLQNVVLCLLIWMSCDWYQEDLNIISKNVRQVFSFWLWLLKKKKNL